jgi:sugar lactone lactonase YvrE
MKADSVCSRVGARVRWHFTVSGLAAWLLSGAALSSPAAAQVNYAGTQTTLSTNFSQPASVAVDARGNVYVADDVKAQVLEILAVDGSVPAGATILKLASGVFPTPTGIAVDGSGDVFVADQTKGTMGQGGVFEILASGGIIPASPKIRALGSGFLHPSDVAVDSEGDVFVADTGNNAVKEMLAVGGSVPSVPVINTLGAAFGFYEPSSVRVDASGNVLVADYIVIGHPDQPDGGVYEIMAAGGYTQVNTLSSDFIYPESAAVDTSGNVYVSDAYGGMVYELLAIDGSIPASPAMIPIGSGGWTVPAGLAVDGMGDVFVADFSAALVAEVTFESVNLGTVALGSTSASVSLHFSAGAMTDTSVSRIALETFGNTSKDFGGASGTTCAPKDYSTATECRVNVNFKPQFAGVRQGAVVVSDASGNLLAAVRLYGTGLGPQMAFRPGSRGLIGSGLYDPEGVAIDAVGNVFVADTLNNAVKEMMAVGGYATIKTLGSGFNQPQGIVLDGSGNVFVADAGNNAVKEILAAGGYASVKTLGNGFSHPMGLALDGNGNLFVADSGNNLVKQIQAAGGYAAVKTLATGYSGFSGPEGLALDASSNLFVADTGNDAVKEILAAGGYATVSAALGSGFANPASVAVEANGNLIVADSGDSAIKEVLAAGGYTTVTSMAGIFSTPRDVALDGGGNVFVADSFNNRVLKLDYADPPALSFATTAGGATSADSPQRTTVVNTGNMPLQFSGLLFSGNFPQASSGDPDPCAASTSLAAGDGCTMSIDFSPQAVSGTSTTLALKESVHLTTNTHNKANTLEQVMLSGTETKLAPGLVLAASSAMGVAGFTTTLKATATGSGAIPAGTVVFKAGGVAIAGPVKVVNGVAVLQAAIAQSETLTATYSGNPVYAQANSNAVPVTVAKVTPTLALTVSPNPAQSGAVVTLMAIASESAAGVLPTGTVAFDVNGVSVGSATLSGRRAVLTFSPSTVGNNPIQATYMGNASYQSANSNTVNLTVTR